MDSKEILIRLNALNVRTPEARIMIDILKTQIVLEHRMNVIEKKIGLK